MRDRQARIGVKLGLLAVAGGCIAALLAAPASSRQMASPVMRVDFRVTGVGGKRPPSVVETRVAGKGRLQFSEPYSDEWLNADSATGTIVVEYDVLSPEPKTIRLTLGVESGAYKHDGAGTNKRDQFRLRVAVVSSRNTKGSIYDCPAGAGQFQIVRKTTLEGYALYLDDCTITLRQQGTPGPNSRVHVAVTPLCLRTVSSRKPLCPSTINLTGTWRGSDGSTFVIKQTGNNVTWSAHSQDNVTWANDFTGHIEGKLLVGGWKDRLTHQVHQTGQLTMRIVDKNHLTYVKSSVPWGTSSLTRAPT